jgi:c-di-GMP-related signal transduction protein
MWGYYVHKEPVLNDSGHTYGHELSFRNAQDIHLDGKWPAIRVDEDVIATLTPQGFERLMGGKRAFLNVHGDAMRSDALGSLPKGCVFQVSEQDGLDKEILLRCALLKKKGYQIAAEESPTGRRLQSFHQVADFVRIDTHSIDDGNPGSEAALLEGLPPRRIATKVQGREAFENCRKSGFDLFQGPFYLDPSTIPSEPISASQVLLMQLWKDLRANREVGLIENAFKNSPRLTYGLLQLINSAFFGVSVKVVSIRQAITLLGYDSLLKWVVLLLFTVDRGNDQSNPVIEKAIVRGRVMESLARQTKQKAVADSAFITGMLSLFPVLFDVTLTRLASEMNLSQEIEGSLLAREGFLGNLLRLAERMDHQEYEGMDGELTSLDISIADVLSAETEAIVDCQSCLFSSASRNRPG